MSKWTQEEIDRLHAAYEDVTRRSWLGDVLIAASNGSIKVLSIQPRQWSAVARIVGTRNPKQCVNRMWTEVESTVREGEQERHAPRQEQAPVTSPRFIPDVSPWYSDRPFAGMSDTDIAEWARS